MSRWQKLSDYVFCYITAWTLIILSPVWFPIWFARKIYRGPKDYEGKESNMRWKCGECKTLLGTVIFTDKPLAFRLGYCPKCQHTTCQDMVEDKDDKEE